MPKRLGMRLCFESIKPLYRADTNIPLVKIGTSQMWLRSSEIEKLQKSLRQGVDPEQSGNYLIF
jgi:hypothetical protein